MDALMAPPTKTTTVAIYDRSGSDAIDRLRPAERLAACYRWATARDMTVLDQVAGFAVADVDPQLDALIELCHAHSAGLLVYSLDCLSPDAERVAAVAVLLGALPILTACQSHGEGQL